MRYVTTSAALMLTVLGAGCTSEVATAPDAILDDPVARFSTGGTAGLAIPQALSFDAGGEFVGEVLVTVQSGWLNAPHSVDITITSVNGSDHFHGHQVEPLSTLETFGDSSQSLVDVVVPWTTDTSPRTVTDIYTVCAHLVFADEHHGDETCVHF